MCTPPQKGAYRCVERDGVNTCPPDYAYTVQAGDGYADTRACSQCICSANERCDGTLTVYSDTACSNEAFALPLDDFSCHALGTNAFAPGSLAVSALEPKATCGIIANPQPTGGVELTHLRTICCAF